MKDSGTHGPCQNPTAPHLQSINASHSRSVPSPTLPLTPSHPPILISKVMHPLFSVCPFFLTDGFIHEFITSLLNPLLFLFTHIQWKNLSPIMSSVGANQVWRQLSGNHRTFLMQRELSHQGSRHSPGLPVTSAKHTLRLWDLASPRCSWSWRS